MTPDSSAKKDIQKLQRAIVDGLEDVKAQDLQVFNTEHLSPLFERVIVASGTSNRQTRALAFSVIDAVREAGFGKPRLEGQDNGEWIIVDCGAAVAHIMQPAIRQYYQLEEIWGDKPVRIKLGAPKPAAPPKPASAAAKPAAARKPGSKAASAPRATAKSPEAAGSRVRSDAAQSAGKSARGGASPAKSVPARSAQTKAAAPGKSTAVSRARAPASAAPAARPRATPAKSRPAPTKAASTARGGRAPAKTPARKG